RGSVKVRAFGRHIINILIPKYQNISSNRDKFKLTFAVNYIL
ncbi:hypothetical protein SZ25_00286, partial [Candidatus Arcanobacter lacustris]